MAQAQPVGLAECQPAAVVQSVPGAHPMPMYAYSIKDPSHREVSSPQRPPPLPRIQIPPGCERESWEKIQTLVSTFLALGCPVRRFSALSRSHSQGHQAGRGGWSAGRASMHGILGGLSVWSKAWCAWRLAEGTAGAKGASTGPCHPGLGLCPPPQDLWSTLTWPCNSPLRRSSPTQPHHKRGSPAKPIAPGRLSRWSLRRRRRPGWPRAPLSSPGPAPPRQSRHPTWTSPPAPRPPP